MTDILGPVDEIVLRSPNGEFRVSLQLGDDGSLYATLLVHAGEEKYEPPQGISAARLAMVRRGPKNQIIQFSSM
ncbi:MAG: hypothetical protein Q7S58_15730 [Candidatus Binatus sp.]|uniref:hypothetical protein n=1 Tax=Candidatus Binatus sp. TaxID=2811406 RepID=UPI00271909F5|nr:hypothetical protein [Candidatus Binatus sp.]MDO8433851.1 hypothetical protein [Candidatus Binatus sp.]